uniref:DegT/DnrJ/EryC1/StrS family aminotransferase n=1 Tax=Flavobacterium psychrophilum TaxID=96345 RepID=UPI00054B6D13
TTGPNVTGFEADLEKYIAQESHVAALSSGTAALHLGLILLGVKPQDEVICQSMTFSASANPIMYLGATPIFIDSELDTWNMCPIALEEAIKDSISKGKKPKAIISVHLYGMPYKIDDVKAISQKYDIPVLEDSAEALGSSYKGQKCGTFGDISVLSFNGNKIITTSGGGALLARNKATKDKAVFLATQARDNAPHYQHSEVGYNYRMSNICAGIGRGQMQVLDQHVGFRRDMHQLYVGFFATIDGVTVLTEPNPDYYSNHWLSAIVINPDKTNGKTREDLRLALEKANIESRPLWKPMHLQPVFESYPYYGTQVSEQLFANGLCLPSGSNLTNEEKKRIFAEIKIFFY